MKKCNGCLTFVSVFSAAQYALRQTFGRWIVVPSTFFVVCCRVCSCCFSQFDVKRRQNNEESEKRVLSRLVQEIEWKIWRVDGRLVSRLLTWWWMVGHHSTCETPPRDCIHKKEEENTLVIIFPDYDDASLRNLFLALFLLCAKVFGRNTNEQRTLVQKKRTIIS